MQYLTVLDDFWLKMTGKPARSRVRVAMGTGMGRVRDTHGLPMQKPTYDWQVDTCKALLLGLDSIVIAGTGVVEAA